MGIRVKHAVSGELAGDIAFQTGRGQRAERDLRVAQQQAAETRRLRLAETARRESLELRKSETAQARLDRIAESEREREFTLERDIYQQAGRVSDLEFGRETGSLAAQAAEERRAREFALAAKHQADGDERQYTLEQQRKKDAINSSRAKIAEGVADGTYTEFQAEQFHQELDKQELGISKMWGPKQITPQDELKQRTFTADNGTLMYIDGKGTVQTYPGQLTPQEKLEATEKEKTQEYEWEQDRKKAAFDAQSTKADMMATLMDKNGLSYEEAATTVDKMFAPPISPEDKQIVDQLKGIGMTDEVIAKAVEQEGSLEAVVQRLQQEADDPIKKAQRLEEEELIAEQTKPGETRESFLKSTAPPSRFGPSIRTPSSDELRGFGGRGY